MIEHLPFTCKTACVCQEEYGIDEQLGKVPTRF